MLAKLFYPVVNPLFNFEFCKGYYPRVADNKMNGRVARLLVFPLLNALLVYESLFSGAPAVIRTRDTRFRKPVLYPLSYRGSGAYFKPKPYTMVVDII